MGEMVSSIFGGGGAQKRAAAEAQRQRELTQIAQARQEEQLRAQEADTAAQTRATGKAPRGRRLLTFAGDENLSSTLGG